MAWLHELSSHPLIGGFVCLVLALTLLVLRRLVHRSPLERRLDASFSLIVIGLLFGGLG